MNENSKTILIMLLIFIAFIVVVKTARADYLELVKFGKYNQAITIYDKQVNTLIDLWYTKTRIIDLITLQSMECASYEWYCKNGTSDIWNFQINQIHNEQYKHSLKLFKKKKWEELYLYQAKYANWLIDWYESNNCSQESFDSIWKERTNEARFNCVAKSYNWSDKRKSYWQLALIKREYIKKYINDNFEIWKK